jgi:hypothetical protein
MHSRRVDGYEAKYPHRRSWKVNLYYCGRAVAQVPVAWLKDWRQVRATRTGFLEVGYQDMKEMADQRTSREPFIVALAEPHDADESPPKVKRIVGVYEVVSTGVQLCHNKIETMVLRRATADYLFTSRAHAYAVSDLNLGR